MSSSDPPPGPTDADRVKLFLQNDTNHDAFDKAIANDLTLVSAAPGEVVFELTVRAAHTNTLGVMHGGCVATVLSMCTSAALVPGGFLGRTRSLNVTYFRPAPVGARVVVTATVVRAGRHLATVRGVLADKADGKVCSTAEHLKYCGVAEARL